MSPGGESMGAERFRASLPPEAYARLVASTAQEAREAGHFVVLGTQRDQPGEEELKSFAEGLGLDLYTARQRLLAQAPRILRREERRSEARRWVAWLKALDLRAFRLSERAFFQFHPVIVSTYERDPEGLRLWLHGGKEELVRRDEVLAVVRGTVHSRETLEAREVRLFGPGANPQRETLRADSVETLDVHMGAYPVIFRFRADALGGGLAGMKETVEILREAFPSSTWVEGFENATGALGSSWEIASSTADFRYTVHGLAPAGRREVQERVVRESEAGAFDLFSLLHRMQLLRA